MFLFILFLFGFVLFCFVFLNLHSFDQVDVGREVCRIEMEVRASLQKVSGSSDSVATLNSEEFVLVSQHADDTSTKDDEKPELKVFLSFLLLFIYR